LDLGNIEGLCAHSNFEQMMLNRSFIAILALSFLPFILLKQGWATSYALGYLIYITFLWGVSRFHETRTQSIQTKHSSHLGFLLSFFPWVMGWAFLILSLQWVFLPIANSQRFVLSSLLLLYFLFMATWFSQLTLPSLKTLQVFAKVFLGIHLLILAVYKVMGVLYIYPEPSHLGLAVIPWFTLLFLSVNSLEKKLLFGLLILFAVLSKNTTLVVFMLMALIWVRPPLYLIIAIVSYILFFNEQQLIERLSFNKSIFTCHTVISESDVGYWQVCPEFVSTSTLVWLKGWHLAYLNLMETFGLGIGFQQLGYAGAYSMISESIRSSTIGHVDLNVYDGGSLAAKMISEMGLLALGFLIYSLGIFCLYVRQVVQLNYFWMACFVGGLFELYIRGYGYFTLNFVAYLAACLYFQKQLCTLKLQIK